MRFFPFAVMKINRRLQLFVASLMQDLSKSGKVGACDVLTSQSMNDRTGLSLRSAAATANILNASAIVPRWLQLPRNRGRAGWFAASNAWLFGGPMLYTTKLPGILVGMLPGLTSTTA
jgi:hypothetical protein